MPKHDTFLKSLYRPGIRDAASLLFPETASQIRWDQLHWLDKEITILGPRRRSVVADLVAATRDVEGRYTQILVHPELQMRADSDMGWRALQYNAGLTLRSGRSDTRVLTMVFYHCAGMGGIQRKEYRLDFYDSYTLGVGYWSVGLGDLEARDYVDRDNPMAWALASWMRHTGFSRPELRLTLQEKILRRVHDDEYREALLGAVQEYFTLNEKERAEEQRLRTSKQYAEVQEMLVGDLGKAEQRGLRTGRREGVLESLMDLLESRFGPVPPEIQNRLKNERSLPRLRELVRLASIAPNLDVIERSL
ncbi:MAG TPA: hypothetical protein VFJ58_25880 [Armatimonadota bacterium]|nr:hypothetical protein [Armatimonadota bacterium]